MKHRRKTNTKCDFMSRCGSLTFNDQKIEFSFALFASEEVCRQKNYYLKTYRTFTPKSIHSGPGLMNE